MAFRRLTVWDSQAIAMMNRAQNRTNNFTNISTDMVRVLGDDLEALADDLRGADCNMTEQEQAAETELTLRERIGGYSNLQSYVNTLLAGKNRKAK